MYIVVTRGVVLVLVCCLPGNLLIQTTEYNDHSIYDIFWAELFILNTMIRFMHGTGLLTIREKSDIEHNDHTIYDMFWTELFIVPVNKMIWFMCLCMVLVCSLSGKILIQGVMFWAGLFMLNKMIGSCINAWYRFTPYQGKYYYWVQCFGPDCLC